MRRAVAETIARIIIGLIVIGVVVAILNAVGFADSYDSVSEAYVLCDDYVNIRPFPNRKGEPLGRLEAGDYIYIDGMEKNGYLHVVGMGLETDGWIHKGYVVYDKPERMNRTAVIVSKGRLAARKHVGGRRTRWLKPQATLKVYCWSDEWCVTNCGYVQTRYLELEGT